MSPAYLRTSVGESGGREMMLKIMKVAKKEKGSRPMKREGPHALFKAAGFREEEFGRHSAGRSSARLPS